MNLLPCPFCGKSETLELWNGTGDSKSGADLDSEDWSDFSVTVVCSVLLMGCGATSGFDEDPMVAIEKWNRRA